MPELENQPTSPKPKPSTVKGIDTPFTKKEAEATEGVDNETRLFHGIDPETKERVSVTLEGLKAEFGEAEGERKYLEIAGIAGGSVFFNARAEATSYRPPLGISGLTGKHAETVAAILAAQEE